MDTKFQIFIGSDHAGFKLKEIIKTFLIKEGFQVKDLGAYEYNSNDDYVDYAIKVCETVLKNNNKGVLICGSGQGMSRAANKFPGIYAEVCWNEYTAKHAKEHSNANVLCFGGRTVEPEVAKKMVKVWLETPFVSEERHIRRFNKTKEIEEKYLKKERK